MAKAAGLKNDTGWIEKHMGMAAVSTHLLLAGSNPCKTDLTEYGSFLPLFFLFRRKTVRVVVRGITLEVYTQINPATINRQLVGND